LLKEEGERGKRRARNCNCGNNGNRHKADFDNLTVVLTIIYREFFLYNRAIQKSGTPGLLKKSYRRGGMRKGSLDVRTAFPNKNGGGRYEEKHYLYSGNR